MTEELNDRVYQVLFRRTKATDTEVKFFIPVPDTGISVTMPIAMSFSIEKSLSSSPNTMDLKLYNLAAATRAEVQLPKVVVRFAAGYQSTGARRMFIGDVRWARSTIKGTEWVTEIQVGDGSRAYAFARSRETFKGGTKIIDVLRFVGESMTLFVPENVAVSRELQAQFSAGYSMNGRSRDELTRLLRPYGYTWSIQDGVLQVLRDDQVIPGAVREISTETGMLGSPEFGNPEASGKSPKRTVNVKLYPELQPGGQVNIISRDLEGLHKILKVRHTGDTQTDEWKTQIEVSPIGKQKR